MSADYGTYSGVTRRSLTYANRIATAHAIGAMNSRVVITRSGAWSLSDFEYDPNAPTTVYDDPDNPGAGAQAGVTPAQGPITMELGDENQYFSNVTVYIPQTAPTNPRIDDLVKVTYCPDPEIEGRFFRVMDVPVGGRINSSIALSCTGIAPSRETVSG